MTHATKRRLIRRLNLIDKKAYIFARRVDDVLKLISDYIDSLISEPKVQEKSYPKIQSTAYPDGRRKTYQA